MPPDWVFDGSVNNLMDLKSFAEEHLQAGRKVYIGLAGNSKCSSIDGEIEQDRKRMITLEKMSEKVAERYCILHTLDGEPGHCRARLAETWLIRELGLHRLINAVHGGAGRHPIFQDLGAVFVLVGR